MCEIDAAKRAVFFGEPMHHPCRCASRMEQPLLPRFRTVGGGRAGLLAHTATPATLVGPAHFGRGTVRPACARPRPASIFDFLEGRMDRLAKRPRPVVAC